MNWLAGKTVTFTGKLASLTRSEAAELVRAHDGRFAAGLTEQTAVLVVGQEGWPLQEDGRVSRKLEKARRLQARGRCLTILSEEEFFQKLGLEANSAEIHQRFSVTELGRLLKLPRERLRSWIRQGLLQPCATDHGIHFFDYQQVTGIRTLWNLARAGVSVERLRKSLDQLAIWLPRLGPAHQQSRLLERNGQLFLRMDDDRLVDPSGQLQLDFAAEETGPRTVKVQNEPTGPEWFQQGCELEDEGKLVEALHAYRQALYAGPADPVVCFNLANTLYALGQLAAAAERFRQALELDHDFVEAWNNLGNTLMELQQTDEALRAFRQALVINPRYADAHYSLADALDQAGLGLQARRHWQDYLALEPSGPWAQYAKSRLAM